MITIKGDNLEVSDGYHTINELYEHRIVLFITLCRIIANDRYTVWMSEKHADGSSYDGWFIMGINTEKGSQISYHLPMRFFNECRQIAFFLEKAPEWDGHTSDDVLKRLLEL